MPRARPAVEDGECRIVIVAIARPGCPRYKMAPEARRDRTESTNPTMSKPDVLQVLSAQLAGPHSLLLRFSDGTTSQVNLLPCLKNTRWMRPLRDPRYFAKFKPDE